MKPSAQPSEVEDHRPGGTSLAEWAKERAAFHSAINGVEPDFNKWMASTSKKLGLSPNPDDPRAFYDYRGFHDALMRGEVQAPDHPGGHFTSRFKLDGHPRTFMKTPDGTLFDTRTAKSVVGGNDIPQNQLDASVIAVPEMNRPNYLVQSGPPTIERVPGPHVELTMGQPTVERTPGSNIELVMGQPTIDRGPQVSPEAGKPSLFRNDQQPGQLAAEDGLFSLPSSRK